ncbi:hypothetical protein BH20ACT22_BH20ACT22_20600 [soil metagenome]
MAQNGRAVKVVALAGGSGGVAGLGQRPPGNDGSSLGGVGA